MKNFFEFLSIAFRFALFYGAFYFSYSAFFTNNQQIKNAAFITTVVLIYLSEIFHLLLDIRNELRNQKKDNEKQPG